MDMVRWQLTPAAPTMPTCPTTVSDEASCAISGDAPKTSEVGRIPEFRTIKRSRRTPGTEQDKPTQNAESQISYSGGRLPILNVNFSDAKGTRFTTADDAGSLNAKRQTPNAERGTSTDTWFQVPTESQEPIDIQEAVVTTSATGSNKVGPQPLAQVLADLARRAQHNFVDPGIPAYETIAYSFTDSDLDPWEAFTRIAQTRGYRIVYRDDIVTLARGQEDSISPANPQTIKAEVWVWLDQTSKPGVDRSGLFIQAAGADVAPNSKPQTVRSLAPGSNAQISLFDVHSERGDSTLRLTLNPVALPNGHIQADLGIENAAPSSTGHKGVTIRRAINRTVELTPTKQVIQIDGILVPTNSPVADKQSWIQRWFRKKAPEPETATARMVVKLTVDPVAGSDTPIRAGNPVRGQKSDPGKTSIALAPSQNRRTPEFIVIQNLKH
jgi:hypothetical protein